MLRRILPGWQFSDSRALHDEAQRLAINIRTRMATQGGWSWTRLQEAYTRALRQREKRRVGTKENEQLWQEELAAKEARIAELEAALAAAEDASMGPPQSEGILDDAFRDALGPECFEGEFSDRLRAALQYVLETGEAHGWDARSLEVFRRILKTSADSTRAKALLSEIRRAAKNRRRSAKTLPRLLEKYGYAPPTNKTHVRLNARPGYEGLKAVTIAKTASDHRTPDNQVSQIKEAMGLNRLV